MSSRFVWWCLVVLHSGQFFAVFPVVSMTEAAVQDPTTITTTTTTTTIAMIEFMQETNSFSPVPTTIRNFQPLGKDQVDAILFYESNQIMDHIQHHETAGHLAGFIRGVQDYTDTSTTSTSTMELVPILQARSVSGGPLNEELYVHFEQHILNGLKQLMTPSSSSSSSSLKGIYLSLHGAMGVEGRTDPEGDLLYAIRQLVGPTMPIAVTHDLHANLTRQRMALMTFLIGYRTNPHRDFYTIGYQAGKLLTQTIHGQIQPTMVYKKMRLLRGGGWTMDFLSPMRQIFQWMTRQEQQNNKVLSLSTFMVHLWLDHDELGWATVAVTDNDVPLADRLATELADLNWEARHADVPTGITPLEALQQTQDAWMARYFGTTVWCDVSDAVGAGAPGESTWILQTLLETAARNGNGTGPKSLVSYLTLTDPDAVHEVFDSSLFIGDNVTVQVGGKLDLLTNRPVTFSGTILKRIQEENEGHGRTGRRTAILQKDGIHLILNEVPAHLHSPSYFTHDLGLSLWRADIVVVKNLFPFRYRYLWYNRRTMDVITPGVTNIDVFQIPYTKIPRPIYPLDKATMDENPALSWKFDDYTTFLNDTVASDMASIQEKDARRIDEKATRSDGTEL
jgi:microcystin degradation protein MlrC